MKSLARLSRSDVLPMNVEGSFSSAERLIENIFQDLSWTSFDPGSLIYGEMMNYRIESDEDRLSYSIDIPGVKAKDIELTIADNVVKVQFVAKNKQRVQSFIVKRDYDPATVKARLEDGVLTLEFEKRPESRSRRIEIETK